MSNYSEVSFIKELIEISRFYGSNPEYTLAGGGNTSFKDDENLFVKASGASLAQASADSFVKMDRRALSSIWDKKYSDSNDEREKEVLADLMAARNESGISAGAVKSADTAAGSKRPSVEALLHDIIRYSFIVHLHPAIVNGLCCSKNGEKTAKEIFGCDILWIPSANPGYILSRLVKTALAEYYAKHKKNASVILLENHGIFIGADTKEAVIKIYDEVMEKISAKIKRKPDFSDELRVTGEKFPQSSNHRTESSRFSKDAEEEKIKGILQTFRELAGFSGFIISNEIAAYIKNRESFYPVSSSFTPDHIVYSGSEPLFTEADTPEAVRGEWEKHTQETGRNPKIIAVKDLGVFSAAASEKAAGFALDLFKDTIKVAVYSENFGGPLFMKKDKIDFINNWEVERFRSSVSTK